MENFSKRYGFKTLKEDEIKIREDAPQELREFIVVLSDEYQIKPSELRSVVCKVLRKLPDRNNWSEYPNIHDEVKYLIEDCKWYKVYDIIEALLLYLSENFSDKKLNSFINEINEFFIENGIGWQIKDLKITMRGDKTFRSNLDNAQNELNEKGLSTASKELAEAIKDLSRRPHPDTTGAIQHSMAALECVARELTGNKNANLGDIMKRNDKLIPRPLDQVVIKAWGYASEYGRHIREGQEPTFEDAELIVGICSSIANYIIKKDTKNQLF